MLIEGVKINRIKQADPLFINITSNTYYPLIKEERLEIYIVEYKELNFPDCLLGGYLFYISNKIRSGFIDNPHKAKYSEVEEARTL